MTLRHLVIPTFLIVCLLLGGASIPAEGGYRANLALQMLSIPLIAWALLRQPGNLPVPARTLLWLAAALLVVALLQLVPLPPAIWTMLPGRARVAEGFAMMGQELPWLPLSLSPDSTIASMLWLLPALAILLGIVRLGAYRSSFLAWSLVAVTIASVMLSALQRTGGEANAFYFYATTNFGMGVGFFANSNHQATLLLCALPFTAALYAGRKRSRSVKGSSGLAIVLGGAASIIAVGLILNGSLAGVGLGVGVALASALLLRFRKRQVPLWGPLLAGLGLIGAATALFLAPNNLGPLGQGANESAASRQEIIGTTLATSGDYFPIGAGIGSFASVYRLQEDPATTTPQWVNHAHSDVAEIALETGVLGIALMALLLWWWGRRAFVIWLRDERPDHYARAATIASAAVIAHSFVDYPLRTAAISAVFAMCLALMAQPRPSAQARSSRDGDEDGPRHLTA